MIHVIQRKLWPVFWRTGYIIYYSVCESLPSHWNPCWWRFAGTTHTSFNVVSQMVFLLVKYVTVSMWQCEGCKWCEKFDIQSFWLRIGSEERKWEKMHCRWISSGSDLFRSTIYSWSNSNCLYRKGNVCLCARYIICGLFGLLNNVNKLASFWVHLVVHVLVMCICNLHW